MDKEILVSDITAKLEEYQEEYRSRPNRTEIGNQLFLFVDYFKERLQASAKTISPLGFCVEYNMAIHSLEKTVSKLERRGVQDIAAPDIPTSKLGFIRLCYSDIVSRVCPPDFAELAINYHKGKKSE